MRPTIPIPVGTVYGLLTVLSQSPTPPGDQGSFWLCRCECGTQKVIRGLCLRRGNTRSCGCLRRERSRQLGKHRARQLAAKYAPEAPGTGSPSNFYLGTSMDLCCCNACVLAQPWRAQYRSDRWSGKAGRSLKGEP